MTIMQEALTLPATARLKPLRFGLALVLCQLLVLPWGALAQTAAPTTGGVSSPVLNPNSVLSAGQRGNAPQNRSCNVPTDGAISPLEFNGRRAIPFTQAYLREEGFGTASFQRNVDFCPDGGNCKTDTSTATFEPPLEANGEYTGYRPKTDSSLDGLLMTPPQKAGTDALIPYPTMMRNDLVRNPWQAAIEETLTGPLIPLSDGAPKDLEGNMMTSFADGRPPGMQYAHQRYAEFYPTRYMKSAVTGSRTNTGLRDSVQMHGYNSGEWGPGGLYHNTVHGMAALMCSREPSIRDDRATCETTRINDASSAYDGELACRWDEAATSCKGRFDGTTKGIPVRFHPFMPVQDEQAVWTFDGTIPPKLLMARYAQPIMFRNYNALPIKFESNRGFGNHFITTHEHNGHVGAESDGYAEAFFLPGQFYDYHWPLVVAGHDSNPGATDPRASTPCKYGETLEISLPSPLSHDGSTCSRAQKLAENPTKVSHGSYEDPAACGWRKELKTCPAEGKGPPRVNIAGDWREIMSTHWFHDHMLDYTAQNVYKGNAAMMNYYSGIDRGNECLDDGVNLRFPAGCAMGQDSWGNRDYDLNVFLSTKAWGQDTARYPGTKVDDTQGQLWFNPFNTDGFIGDRMLVNLLWMPYLDVRARSYRIRLLNGDVSRFMAIAFVVKREDELGEFPGETPGTSYDRVPVHVIANDGNIMEHTVPFDGSIDLDNDGDLQDHNGVLPTQSIAERFDVIIDFENYEPGTLLYALNLLEHDDGKRPERQVPLADVLSGNYSQCDPAVGKFLEIRVHSCTQDDGVTPADSCQPGSNAMLAQQDMSMDPAQYVPGNTNGPDGTPLKMIPLPVITEEALASAHHRTFEFGRGAASDGQPVTITPADFTSPPRSPEDARKMMPSPSTAVAPDAEFGWSRGGRSVNTDEFDQIPDHPPLPWGIKVDDSDMRVANFNQVSAAPKLGDLEVWHIQNGGGGWSHNVHVHFEEGRILTRDGKQPPEWEKWARKDVYRVGRMDDSGSEVTFAIRFREFGGSYMEHCHNTQHEDHAMLLRWDIENPGQLKPFLLPEPQWNGCTYTESDWLPTASAQNSASPGNADAKDDFWSEYSAADVLCPSGATQDCPSAPEQTGLQTPAPTTPPIATAETTTPPPVVVNPPPVVTEDTTPPRLTREERRAAKEAEKDAKKEAKEAGKTAKKAAKEARKAAKKKARAARKRNSGAGE